MPDFLQVFAVGTSLSVLLPAQAKNSKLQVKAKVLYFVGQDADTNDGIRRYDQETGNVLVRRNKTVTQQGQITEHSESDSEPESEQTQSSPRLDNGQPVKKRSILKVLPLRCQREENLSPEPQEQSKSDGSESPE